MRRLSFVSLFLVFFMALSPVQAGILDAFLMPGPVVEAHAPFEDKCESCHLDLEKEKQNLLCLDCHDHSNIAKDIKENTGFHGLNKIVKSSPCKHCHTDHKGRDKNIVLLDQDSFNHDNTDFVLKGAHTHMVCASCHGVKKYSEAPSLCISCHEKDDTHKGNLGDRCGTCHNENNWADKKFDHDKDTKYPLKGKHVEVICDLCHIGKKYKDIPKDCVACHQINDVHDKKNGTQCETCHTSKKWDEIQFDHMRDAKYELTGRHQQLNCINCHKGSLYKDKLETSCISCHKNDDLHNGKNGNECKSCHTTSNWNKSTFSHDKDTDFPLQGLHKDLVCESCHKAQKNDQLKRDKKCISCHHDDDVHKGQEGDTCSNCHNEKGWGNEVFFQHDITKFPLIGFHAALACEECHLSSEFQGVELECNSCHAPDDIHEKRLGVTCHTCHNPNGWVRWVFNHDIQTDYELTGKHDGLDCHACHREPLEEKNKMSQSCVSCHRKDDEHEGRFGKDCVRCHNTESFSDITYRN